MQFLQFLRVNSGQDEDAGIFAGSMKLGDGVALLLKFKLQVVDHGDRGIGVGVPDAQGVS